MTEFTGKDLNDLIDSAKDYEKSMKDEATLSDAFLSGANCAKRIMTRWHDVNEELPEPYENVLVQGQIKGIFYVAMRTEPNEFTTRDGYHPDVRLWRYVYE